jgi:OmpA-OmpF porin, OOP family
MKRLVVWAVVAGVLIFASSAFAGVTPRTFSLTPYIGGYTFDGAQSLETQPVYGLRAGYSFTSNWAGELSFDYVNTGFTKNHRIEGSDNNVNAFKYRLDALYHFMPEKRLVPFVAAGLGGSTINYPSGYSTSYSTNIAHHDHTTALFNYGVGLKYFMTDYLALRGDLRHVVTFDRFNNNLEYTVGLSYIFGVRKPAPKPVEQCCPPPPPPPPPPVEEQVCITLKIEFDFDKADIKPKYHDQIKQVSDFMTTYPETTAVIEGHTDNVGTADYNEKLSLRRAESVRQYLVDKLGISPARLKSVGYGFNKPIADNGTAEGRAKNRRIDAVIDCAVKK